MTKKRVSQVNKEEDAKREAFWADIRELEKEHNMALSAFLQYSQMGIIPVIGAKILETPKKDGNAETTKTD